MGRRLFVAGIIGALLCSISFGYSGWIAGKTGNALAFDGVNDYVEVAGYKGIVGTQSRTCCAWIKTTSTQQSYILSWGADQAGQKWAFRAEDNGTLSLAVYGGYVNTTTTINDGQWHHVAAVLNDDGSPSVNEILLYIDGVLQSTTATNTQSIETVASNDMVIGVLNNAGTITGYFNGLLDEVSIYNRALDASEIDLQSPIPTDGLIAHWAMDETEGGIAHDTISSYDGILWYMSSGYSGGSGTIQDPYQIATKEDLLDLSGLATDYNKYFILTEDIDLEGHVFFRAIIAPDTRSSSGFQGTYFRGIFDGNGHKITNFAIDGGNNGYLALFGYISENGQIKNLGIEDYVINSGGSYIGGLAGYNYYGTITQCYTTGIVSGYGDVGGLAGYNRGNSSSLGVITSCYATGSVKGSFSVGGLVGENEGSVNQCYSTGAVSGLSIYSDFTGGLVGYGSISSVKNSFWDTQTSGQATSAGGTGKTTAEMKTQATFAGIGWAGGMSGNGLYFDGLSAYVKMLEYYGIGGSGARTVSLWIKPIANGQTQTLIQWGADTTGQLWMLCLLPDGTLKMAAYDGGVQSSKPLSYNQWHHIVVTLPEGQTDSGQICLYVDGQSQAVALANHCTINTSQAVPVHLGAWYRPSTGGLLNYFYGLMDDVCIYDRALDGSEIAPVSYAAGLVNHWKFDESMGTAANDSIGSQHGELHNMAVSGWSWGRAGNALSFDGINDYVEATGYQGILGTQSRTCCAWIKTTSVQQGYILSWGADQAGQKWAFRAEANGTLSLAVYGGYVNTTATINDGQWHHVAAALNDDGSPDVSEILIYIDGILQSTAASSTQSINTVALQDVMIGAIANAGVPTAYFNGILDDVCIYDRALESSEIASDVVAADGLVAHWKMDESEGTLAYDSAGDYDGTLYHISGSGRASGQLGNALIFDGIDDYVDVPGNYGIGGTSARTVGVWIKTAATGKTQSIVQWGSDTSGQLWMLRVEPDGTAVAAVYGGNVQSTRTVADNQWHYIAAVLDEGQTASSQIRLYIDGKLDAVANGLTTIQTALTVPVHIGAWKLYSTGGKTYYFQGMIDDVCIYDRALDGSEIAPVYYTTGLTNHWKLDESQGSTAEDSAGTQQGVLHNMADSSWGYGRTGKALTFDGTDDYVDIPGHFGIGGADARTVSLWVKTSASGQTQSLVQWGSDATGQLWMICIMSDNTVAAAAYGGRVSSVQPITDGQWHHIAAVLDEGQTESYKIRLYIDGKPDAVATGLCTVNTSQTVPIHLGASYMTSTKSLMYYYSGQMDDVCIYNRAIKIGEIFPANEYPVSTEGLAARWRMDETEGAIVHDTTGSHDGILNSAGWDFNPCWIDGDAAEWIIPEEGTDYPKLRWQIPSTYHGGSGTVDDPYQIAYANDILLLSDSRLDWDKHFILTCDVDMGGMIFPNAVIAMYTGTSSNLPWGTDAFNSTVFEGTFDGNGHTISNFTIHGGSNDYLGLFGYVGSNGQIKNLGLENCTISATSGSYYMGSLAGFNAGAISQCYTKGTVSGYYHVGGLVGGNGGEISNCYNTGPVVGHYIVGGLVGLNSYSDGVIVYNNYNRNILNCYSTGTVNGDYNLGGLVGFSYRGTVINCYWDTQSSGLTTSAGGTGKTTAQMQTLSTFTDAGWDFADTWYMNGYPHLQWEASRSQDGLIPLGFVTIQKTRTGRTTFEYELAVIVRNSNSYDMTNLQMQLKDWDAAVLSVSDDSIAIDTIPAGATVTSTDTFKIVVDRSMLINSSKLAWILTYYVPAYGTEVQQTVSMLLSGIGFPGGDITKDGKVNLEDFVIMSQQWDDAPGSPSADIASPWGHVGIEDLIYLAENWLTEM